MAEETKKEAEKTDYIKNASENMKAIDKTYKDKISKLMTVKEKIADRAGTQSSTKIAGLRGLEPRLGQQFAKKYKQDYQ